MSAEPSAEADRRSSNIALVRAFIDALNAWDFESLRRIVHPTDYERVLPFAPPGMPRRAMGADEWIERLEWWRGQLVGGENLHDLRNRKHENHIETLCARQRDAQRAVG